MSKQDFERAEDFIASRLTNCDYERGPEFLRQMRLELGAKGGTKYLSTSFIVPDALESEAAYRVQRERENKHFKIEMDTLDAEEALDRGDADADVWVTEVEAEADALGWREIEKGRARELERQSIADRKMVDELHECFNSFVQWIEKRVDKILLKGIKDIQKESTDRAVQMRTILKTFKSLLKGDITTVRSDLKLKLSSMEKADSYAKARTNMEMVHYVADKLEQSVEEYGGETGVTEEEKIKAFSSKLVAEAFDLQTMRTMLDMLPRAGLTWDLAAKKAKEILDRNQKSGKDSKSVNLATSTSSSSSSRVSSVNSAGVLKVSGGKNKSSKKGGGMGGGKENHVEGSPGVCWAFERSGECKRGNSCKFDHVDASGKVVQHGRVVKKASAMLVASETNVDEESEEVEEEQGEEDDDDDNSSRVSAKIPRGTLAHASSANARKVQFTKRGERKAQTS